MSTETGGEMSEVKGQVNLCHMNLCHMCCMRTHASEMHNETCCKNCLRIEIGSGDCQEAVWKDIMKQDIMAFIFNPFEEDSIRI